MSTRLAVWGAALGLGAAALLFAPASWLAQGVAQATGARMQWPNASGTVWQGQADWLLSAGPGSAEHSQIPQGVRWSLRPRWSDGPALGVRLWLPCCASEPLQGGVALGSAGLRWWLDPHHSRWQTQWLSGLGTPWNTLQLDGALQLQLSAWQGQVARQRASASGELNAQVQDMATRLSTLRPVGSYALQLRSTPERSTLELSTLRGDLQLQGQGQWVGGRLRFTGEASASPDREAALSNLLNIIGRRQGSRSVIQIG
jgi:general secretion pathway protein N